jgi:hypothetical protein
MLQLQLELCSNSKNVEWYSHKQQQVLLFETQCRMHSGTARKSL